MDSFSENSNEMTIRAKWVIPASRPAVYSVVSDFEKLASNFPKLARSARVTSRTVRHQVVEVIAASFGRHFPCVRITIDAELLPNVGYRCSTRNHTFSTTGKEELILSDVPGGTEINYAYVVKVRYKWLRPLYGWLVRRFGLPYWKRNYLDPLTQHVAPRAKP